ncbi:hypothetical protein AADZ90_011050 [Aestuariibius sp. 2305UL40-4]|uniref:hypothetical protein n=1 Tax=Aestuariibius violaceus TaxID=3234132 RepID=UPI00345EC7AB
MTRGLKALCAMPVSLVASPALAEETERYGQQQVAYLINGTGGEIAAVIAYLKTVAP